MGFFFSISSDREVSLQMFSFINPNLLMKWQYPSMRKSQVKLYLSLYLEDLGPGSFRDTDKRGKLSLKGGHRLSHEVKKEI